MHLLQGLEPHLNNSNQHQLRLEEEELVVDNHLHNLPQGNNPHANRPHPNSNRLLKQLNKWQEWVLRRKDLVKGEGLVSSNISWLTRNSLLLISLPKVNDKLWSILGWIQFYWLLHLAWIYDKLEMVNSSRKPISMKDICI